MTFGAAQLLTFSIVSVVSGHRAAPRLCHDENSSSSVSSSGARHATGPHGTKSAGGESTDTTAYEPAAFHAHRVDHGRDRDEWRPLGRDSTGRRMRACPRGLLSTYMLVRSPSCLPPLLAHSARTRTAPAAIRKFVSGTNAICAALTVVQPTKRKMT